MSTTRAERQLAQAIAETPEPPCTGCRVALACARMKQACPAWGDYVETGNFDPSARGFHLRPVSKVEE